MRGVCALCCFVYTMDQVQDRAVKRDGVQSEKRKVRHQF